MFNISPLLVRNSLFPLLCSGFPRHCTNEF